MKVVLALVVCAVAVATGCGSDGEAGDPADTVRAYLEAIAGKSNEPLTSEEASLRVSALSRWGEAG
jgi:hypothetical protein